MRRAKTPATIPGDDSAASPPRRKKRGLPRITEAGQRFREEHNFHEAGSRRELNFIFTGQLTMVARGWRTLLNESLREIGQTQARWDALYWISLAGDASNQSALAERMAVEGPTLVRMLNKLEEEGLVQRVADPADRRAKTIRLSADAETILARIAQIAGPIRDDVLSDVTEAEMRTCLSVFDRILARLEKD